MFLRIINGCLWKQRNNLKLGKNQIFRNNFLIKKVTRILYGVVDNVQDSDIIDKEFEPLLRYHVDFWTNNITPIQL